ncbi:hypothetical protein [Streptomyces sp. HPF1205]|uniref:hypothetical protein n=1 Tax=Streptomyces sp. HPF1205 TaxID=2873262 RepID=UPI001CED3537|nr:hypothetical protein [Streptomyces sp. HPF1205]
MTPLPNRRDDEVRRLLDTPHPAVPVDLAARAALRGRRIVHRRRVVRTLLWTLALAALIAGAVLAAVLWRDPSQQTGTGAWLPPGT